MCHVHGLFNISWLHSNRAHGTKMHTGGHQFDRVMAAYSDDEAGGHSIV